VEPRAMAVGVFAGAVWSAGAVTTSSPSTAPRLTLPAVRRGKPRWSVNGGPANRGPATAEGSPAPRAGLPGMGNRVFVGPPKGKRLLRRGSWLMMVAVPVKPAAGFVWTRLLLPLVLTLPPLMVAVRKSLPLLRLL